MALQPLRDVTVGVKRVMMPELCRRVGVVMGELTNDVTLLWSV